MSPSSPSARRSAVLWPCRWQTSAASSASSATMRARPSPPSGKAAPSRPPFSGARSTCHAAPQQQTLMCCPGTCRACSSSPKALTAPRALATILVAASTCSRPLARRSPTALVQGPGGVGIRGLAHHRDAFASASNARAARYWIEFKFPEPGSDAIDALSVPDWASSPCPVCGLAH